MNPLPPRTQSPNGAANSNKGRDLYGAGAGGNHLVMEGSIIENDPVGKYPFGGASVTFTAVSPEMTVACGPRRHPC